MEATENMRQKWLGTAEAETRVGRQDRAGEASRGRVTEGLVRQLAEMDFKIQVTGSHERDLIGKDTIEFLRFRKPALFHGVDDELEKIR